MPVCLVPLLRHEIRSYFEATLAPITFPDSHLLSLVASQIPSPDCPVPTLPGPVDPQMWDISALVIVTHHQPGLIHFKDPLSLLSSSQSPMSETHYRGLKPIIAHLPSSRLLILTDSPCNTHVLLVHKPSSSYCLIQNLHLK